MDINLKNELRVIRMALALYHSKNIAEEDKSALYAIFFNRMSKEVPARIMRELSPCRYYHTLYDRFYSPYDLAFYLEDISSTIREDTMEYHREYPMVSKSLTKKLHRRYLYTSYNEVIESLKNTYRYRHIDDTYISTFISHQSGNKVETLKPVDERYYIREEELIEDVL